MKHAAALVVSLCCLTALPAFAAERNLNESSHHPSQPGKTVLVDVTSLDVSMRTADVREIEVTTDLHISGVKEERAESWIERHTPELEDAKDQLRITARPGKGGFLGIGLLTARSRIGLVIPRSVVPDITTTKGTIHLTGDFSEQEALRLRTADGNVDFKGAAYAVDLRTSAGDCHIEIVRPLEDLFFRSSSGSITVVGGARSVHLDTASGDVWLDNLSGSVEIESSNGKVNLRWDRIDPAHTVNVRTSSGKISLILPGDASPRGSLTTTSGSIRSGFPGVVNEEGTAVTLKGDGPTFNVAATTGEILLSQAEQ